MPAYGAYGGFGKALGDGVYKWHGEPRGECPSRFPDAVPLWLDCLLDGFARMIAGTETSPLITCDRHAA